MLLTSPFFHKKFRVVFLGAFQAYTVAEFCLGMLTDIRFDLLPIAFIIAYFLTVCTYRQ